MEFSSVQISAHALLEAKDFTTAHVMGYFEDGKAYITNICPSVPPGQETSSVQFQQVYMSYLSSTKAFGIPVGWSLQGELTNQAIQFHKQLDSALFGAVLLHFIDGKVQAYNGALEEVELVVESNPLLSNFLIQKNKVLLSYVASEDDSSLIAACRRQ